MSARRGSGGGRRRGGGGEVESEERWLLTYADMITLLMALFMVLFSITSVNKSKLDVLTKSLQQAFSGEILPGGKSIRNSGASEKTERPSASPPIPAITALVSDATSSESAKSAAKEQEDFRRLKAQIDGFAKDKGLQDKVHTVIARRGLVIRLLTDKVLFDSGSADLKPEANPLLAQVAGIVGTERRHKVTVEGYTDPVPIRGSVFPTNWELSTARASRVVRSMIEGGVAQGRLSASGYAAMHPIADNGSAAGRSRNRRVEIVLLRTGQGAANQGGDKP